MRWFRRRAKVDPIVAMQRRRAREEQQRRDDARLDAMIANEEHYGRCWDCEVGEPHACPIAHERYVKACEAIRGMCRETSDIDLLEVMVWEAQARLSELGEVS